MAPLRPLVLLGMLCAATSARADPVSRWQPYIAEAARRFALPERWIVRVMRAESGGQTHLDGAPIRSSAGAIGLMQLMPATWAAMRGANGLGIDPDDPRDNILAGTAFLRMMYDRFGYPGLFGAYNAGPARYAAFRATGRRLPGETMAYLDKVTDARREVVVARVTPPRATLFAMRAEGAISVSSRALLPADGALFAVDHRTP